MLISFYLRNFKSFRDEIEFNLVWSNSDKDLQENYFNVGKKKILKSAIVYGQNASWKTTLFDALFCMKNLVIFEQNIKVGDNIPNIAPFLLDENSKDQNSEFEIIFLYNDLQYRFWFELNQKSIVSEWLYITDKKEVCIYERWEKKFLKYNKSSFETRILKNGFDDLRENMLFLTQAVSFFEESWKLKNVFDWFRDKLELIKADNLALWGFTKRSIKSNPTLQNQVLSLLKVADLGISTFTINEDADLLAKMRVDNIPDFIIDDLTTKIETFHQKWDTWAFVKFDLKDESSWTKRLFNLSWPLFQALEQWQTLIIDELSSHLHTLLEEAILKMFNSTQFNPNNAQLIANTHNTNLLNRDLMRRDQLWITEKNNQQVSELFSLSDIKVNKKIDLEDAYLKGRFGWIPKVNIFNLLDLNYEEIKR